MLHRFFQLLYAISNIVLLIALPIYIVSNIESDSDEKTSFAPTCLLNNKNIVLQGSEYDEILILDNFFLHGENSIALKKQFNFYCKYYNEIQPHITTYIESLTEAEKTEANVTFNKFKDSVYSDVLEYPPLYELEIVSQVTQWNKIYYIIIESFIIFIFWFLSIQTIRIGYIYVVFGKIIWHPFKKINNLKL